MSSVRRSLVGGLLGSLLGISLAAAQASQPAKPQPAAPATGIKIGFVNAAALLKGMPGYVQAESTWTKEAEAANSEAQKLRAVFDTAVAQYQQSQAMMTPSNRTAKERQLQAQQDTLQGKLQQLSNRVAAKERELLQPLQERLRAIIDGIRAEGNYAVIIDIGSEASANIISYDKSLDITVRVAQRLAQTN
jgi:Skp family chaperone for outer membrane proteins